LHIQGGRDAHPTKLRLFVDILFKCTTAYQVRQTIEEQAWQFVNGQGSLFAGVPPGTVDHPDPQLPCWNPPQLRTIDTPGWSAYRGVGSNTRQLSIDNRMSDINATVVWVQQNFYTWVEGERVFTGGWEPVSVRYPWHNSVRLERATPTANWIVAPSTRIQPGHMEFGSNPPTESQ
jgi:hypothetical protein